MLEIEVTLNIDAIILDNVYMPQSRAANLIVLVAKQYLYRCKCQKSKINIEVLRCEI